MDDIHTTFDYGYDPDVVEMAPRVTPPRPAATQGPQTVNPAWLPPVGRQTSPCCFVWSSTYGLATFFAAQNGDYTPDSADQQASPTYTYIQIQEQEGIISGACTGGMIGTCLGYLQAHGGTPTMQAAPNQPGCAATWEAYGKGGLAPDPRFAVPGFASVAVTGPDGLDNVRAMILAGVPLAYGTRLYTDFPGYDGTPSPYVGNGVILINKVTGKPAGHCMMIIGFDDTAGAVLIQNSFGPGWGSQWNGTGGYIWMAYDTFQTLAQGSAAFITTG
jgi:hypothetical protein